jgi:hypothetical protein
MVCKYWGKFWWGKLKQDVLVLVPSDGENCLKLPASKDFERFEGKALQSSSRKHSSVSSYQAEPVPRSQLVKEFTSTD